MTKNSFVEHSVKHYRRQHDLTQEELAERVVCSTDTIRKIESGARRPSREIAERLADVFAIAEDQREAFIRHIRTDAAVPHSPQQDARSDGEPATGAQQMTQPLASQLANLPPQATPFIGREHELAALGDLLADPAHRLITVVGPGGIGKTRLVLQAAIEQREQFADGVAWVPLAPVQSSSLIAQSITDALGLIFPVTANLDAQLIRYLHDKRLLLVLDNFEHLMSGVAFLSTLLQQAPQVTLLITSRVRLNLLEEWVWELGGLALPDTSTGEAIRQSSAVTLFLQRAQRAQHDLALSEDEYAAVARICALLDGLPLGIELAAAWMRLLSPTEIVQEIERSLDFLETTLWNVPARHRSLRAVFHHSWSLLTEEERRVLRRLSVFRGGFTREAAADVTGATLRHLASLVDKSLLRRVPGDLGKLRYDMHEVVRQYAAAQLAEQPGEELATREQHSRYYAAWLRDHERMLKSADQALALVAYRTELDNLRLAWDWLCTHRRTAELWQITPSLAYFYEVRAWYEEGRAAFKQAVDTLQTDAPVTADDLRAYGLALTNYGWFSLRTGHTAHAHQRVRSGIDLLRQQDEPMSMFTALFGLGYVQTVLGEYEEACAALEEGIAFARIVGDPWGLGVLLTAYGTATSAQGRLHEANDLLHEALASWRITGELRGTAWCLNALGAVVLALGRFAEARSLLQESFTLGDSVGDPWSSGTALNFLGQVARAQGDDDEALTLFDNALERFRKIDASAEMIQALNNIADIALEGGEDHVACRYCAEALHTAKRAHIVPFALDTLARLAQLERDQLPQQALFLSSFVIGHPSSSPDAQARCVQLRQTLMADLPLDQVAVAEERARTATFDSVLNEALH